MFSLSKQIAEEERVPQVLGGSTRDIQKQKKLPCRACLVLLHALSVTMKGLEESQSQEMQQLSGYHIHVPHPATTPAPDGLAITSRNAANSLGNR